MSDKVVMEQRRSELEFIRLQSGGVIRPEDVVEFARNATTALHSCFTWDDTEAAKEYRLWQARQVIRVCVTIREEVSQPVRCYVSLYDDRGEHGYRAIDDVLSDVNMRDKLIEQALRELSTWRRKYEQLKALTPVFSAAERIERQRKKRLVAGETKKAQKEASTVMA